MAPKQQRTAVRPQLRPIGVIRSVLKDRREAPRQGAEGRRRVLQVHPRSELRNPLTGVFATRSPDRPNPLGLHPVVVRAIEGRRLRIGPIEAIDGTPVIDIKPVMSCRLSTSTKRIEF